MKLKKVSKSNERLCSAVYKLAAFSDFQVGTLMKGMNHPYWRKAKRNGEYGYYNSVSSTLLMIIMAINPKSFLDIGSGTGLLVQSVYSVLESTRRRRRRIIGVEVEESFLRLSSGCEYADLLKCNLKCLIEGYQLLYTYEPFQCGKKAQEFANSLSENMAKDQMILMKTGGEGQLWKRVKDTEMYDIIELPYKYTDFILLKKK